MDLGAYGRTMIKYNEVIEKLVITLSLKGTSYAPFSSVRCTLPLRFQHSRNASSCEVGISMLLTEN